MKKPNFNPVPFYLVWDGRVFTTMEIDGFCLIEFTFQRDQARKLLASDAGVLQKAYPGSLVLSQYEFSNFKLATI